MHLLTKLRRASGEIRWLHKCGACGRSMSSTTPDWKVSAVEKCANCGAKELVTFEDLSKD